MICKCGITLILFITFITFKFSTKLEHGFEWSNYFYYPWEKKEDEMKVIELFVLFKTKADAEFIVYGQGSISRFLSWNCSWFIVACIIFVLWVSSMNYGTRHRQIFNIKFAMSPSVWDYFFFILEEVTSFLTSPQFNQIHVWDIYIYGMYDISAW